MEGQKSNISGGMWILLFFLLGIVDIVQILVFIFIPIIGWIVNIVANVFIGIPLAIYLHIKGVSMFKGKALIRLISTFIIDEATAGLAPAWTIALIYTYRSEKAKQDPKKLSSKVFKMIDKAIDLIEPGSSKAPLNQGGVRRSTNSLPPMNSGGTRAPRKV